MSATAQAANSLLTGRLQLVEHYAVPLEDGKIQIRHAIQSAVLSGQMVARIFPRLFPLLDGTRTLQQVESQIDDLLTHEQLLKVVSFLKSKDLLRIVEAPPPELEAEAPSTESVARFFGRRGSRYDTLLALKQASIGVISDGPVVPSLIAELAHLGVPRISVFGSAAITDLDTQQTHHYRATAQSAARGREDFLKREVLRHHPATAVNVADFPEGKTEAWESAIRDLSMLVVVLQGPILFHPWLEHLNAAALSLGIPWTSVALLDGDTIHIGPTIRPGITACYKCFELRLKSNLAFYEQNEFFEQHVRNTRDNVDFGFLPPVAQIVAGLAAIEVVRTLSPDMVAKTSGKLMVFNVSEFSSEFHPVLKLPRCSACSPVRNKPRQRVWS